MSIQFELRLPVSHSDCCYCCLLTCCFFTKRAERLGITLHQLTSSRLLASSSFCSFSKACQSFLASIDIILLPIYILFIVTSLPVTGVTGATLCANRVIGLLTSKKRPVDFSRGHEAAFSTANVFLFLFVSTSAPSTILQLTNVKERPDWRAYLPI
jgi:hypothetical protein